MSKNILAVTLLILITFTTVYSRGAEKTEQEKPKTEIEILQENLNESIKELWDPSYDALFMTNSKITSLKLDDDTLIIDFSGRVGWKAIDSDVIKKLEGAIESIIPSDFADLNTKLLIAGLPIEDLVPRAKRGVKSDYQAPEAAPVISYPDIPGPDYTNGLMNRHLVLSSSHGWMYDLAKSLRWEWQRGRIFCTVEDLHTMSYMLPFLVPMMEQAGGIVYYVKDRDWQINEIVIDNGDSLRHKRADGTVTRKGRWRKTDEPGFKNYMTPYPDGFNPHRAGDVHVAKADPNGKAKFRWIPNIPEEGEYGVYVSYSAAPDRASDARYTVHHLGGQTTYIINQKISGNTWVWLGRFKFTEGYNPSSGRVELSNRSSEPGTTVSADAVKIGGGLGVVEKAGVTSGYRKYLEAARYWFQYTGADPETTYKRGYTKGTEGPDYTDDFVSRGEWANYLMGAPAGPNGSRDLPGLGIPIDLMISFHTDAGISDGIIGTLSIYKYTDEEKNTAFPDGRSRLLNRELAQYIQDQIVGDVRANYTSTWTRRALRDGDYSESRRPNMPSMLLEHLSHQNFNDMKYGLDPRFRRDVSRAIYKGALRFLAYENGYEPVVKPLPPTHLAVRKTDDRYVQLSWQAQDDPLEPTAAPDGYIVYTREDDGGFDNGQYTIDTKMKIGPLKRHTIYSFRVDAVNTGGRSMPSETLAVVPGDSGMPRVLVVYGFDRIGPPSYVQEENYAGFDRTDKGVGYLYNFGISGDQYDFDPKLRFNSNDNTGHGSSAGNIENELEMGNSFDYVARHGRSLLANNVAFDSVSDEALEAGIIHLRDYDLVTWILGEQRTEYPPDGFGSAGHPDMMKPQFKTFTPELQKIVKKYLDNGGKLFVSGAYIGTDLAGPRASIEDKEFLNNVLHVHHVTNNGSRTNDLITQKAGIFDGLTGLHFASGLGEDNIYGVELPDALDPAPGPATDPKLDPSLYAKTVLRYRDRNFSAGVTFKDGSRRSMVLGFPFETITGQTNRDRFMKKSLNFLME